MPSFRRLRAALRRRAGIALTLLLALPGSPPALADGEDDDMAFAGSFVHRIPIEAPPFHGLEPRLSLVYSSAAGDGRLGVGWRLAGFSVIERASPGRGAPRHDASDVFLLDGEELVPYTGRGGTHTTRRERFLRIKSDAAANRWHVWRRDGTKLTYAPLYGTAFAGTFRWVLDALVDTHGNSVDYNHWCDGSSDCYPDNVVYNGNRVQFYWEGRNADVVTYANGSDTSQTRLRLRSAIVYRPGALRNWYIRGYKIGYTRSVATGRLLLTNVQQYGNDLAHSSGLITGGTALPATAAAYSTAPAGFDLWTWVGGDWSGFERHEGDFNGDGRADIYLHGRQGTGSPDYMGTSTGSGVNTWTWAPGQNWSGYELHTGDFNGDGKHDILLHGRQGTGLATYMGLSSGSGFTTWTWAPGANWSSYEMHVDDFNGDGRDDVLLHGRQGTGLATYMGLSTGSGFSTWSWAPGQNWSSYELRTGDFDGDGKSDILLHGRKDTGNATYMGVSTGSGFEVWTWAPGANWSSYEVHVGDFNGDDKDDVYLHGRQGTGLHDYLGLSRGRGFGLWSWTSGDDWSRFELHAGDFNGDTRADIYLHGRKGTADPDYLGTATGTGFNTWTWAPGQAWGSYELHAADFDGDGKIDISLHGRQGTGASDYFGRASGGPPDLLASVRSVLGGTSSLTYKPSSAYANTYLPAGKVLYAVSSLTRSDGRGWSSKTDYTYSGARWDPLERRFLGFRYLRATDPTGGYRAVSFRQTPGHPVNRVEEACVADAAGTCLKYDTFSYSETGSSGVYTSFLSQVLSRLCDAASCKTTKTTFLHDAYGNVKEKREYGDTALGADQQRTTVTQVFANTTKYVVDRPGTVTVRAGIGSLGAIQARTQIYYDGATAYTTPPGKGDPTKLERWLSTTGAYLPATTTYAANGNVLSVTDAENATTSFEYDASGVFLAKVTNALGHVARTTWDAVLARPTDATDPNLRVTRWRYDPLGRLTREDRPDASWTTFAYNSFGSPGSQHLRTVVSDGTSNGLWREAYLDGLGRTYDTRREPYRRVETRFDSRGFVSQVSAPRGALELPKWTLFQYDAAGRRTKVTHADSKFRTTRYEVAQDLFPDRFARVELDERGAKRRYAYDGYGRLAVVTEWDGGPLFPDRYDTRASYDRLDRITQVTDALGNATTLEWDSLGRKTEQIDPDMGLWKYAYDKAGRLTSQTDAKLQTLTMSYDKLGRLTSKKRGTTTLATLIYDSTAGHGDGIGRLTTATDPSGSTDWSYDALGRVTGELQNVAGHGSFNVSRSYDLAGRLKSLTYPDGEVVAHSYDDAGFLKTVGGYVTSAIHDARGDLTSRTLGNGVTETFGYDPQRFWVTRAKATNALGEVLQDFTFSRSAVGEVKSKANVADAHDNWSFGYDDLRRLTSATNNSNPAWSESFSVDPIGRITWQTSRGSLTYPADGQARPHAPLSAGGVGLSYDANGNRLTYGSEAYAYDAENRLVQASLPSGVHGYAYNAFGVRVKETPPGQSARVFAGSLTSTLYEKQGSTIDKYYYFGPSRVARRFGGAVLYYHGDHIGTSHIMSDATGSVASHKVFSAYGRKLEDVTARGLSDPFGLAGQRLDASGLYHMGIRYADPRLGQFVTPDPTAAPRLADPQSLNRYAYARNNPVRITDPTGADDTDDTGDFDGFDDSFDDVGEQPSDDPAQDEYEGYDIGGPAQDPAQDEYEGYAIGGPAQDPAEDEYEGYAIGGPTQDPAEDEYAGFPGSPLGDWSMLAAEEFAITLGIPDVDQVLGIMSEPVAPPAPGLTFSDILGAIWSVINPVTAFQAFNRSMQQISDQHPQAFASFGQAAFKAALGGVGIGPAPTPGSLVTSSLGLEGLRGAPLSAVVNSAVGAASKGGVVGDPELDEP
ncbi:MAG: VCBS repeat-containing protein [Acidobacteria bacterium]|nr:VCBS repeat-containing protein [Acidobacteriota bacterium]